MATFSPIQVGRMELSNRLAVAPMSRLRNPDHTPTEHTVEHYRQRAAGEPGTLIIAESAMVSPQAGGYKNVPGIWSDKQKAVWQQVTKAVHQEKSYIYLQLCALGRLAKPEVLEAEGPFPVVGPSAISAREGTPPPKELTQEEIKEYVHWFVESAKAAIEAGFDGVEVHSANGSLPDQFLHLNSNQRSDEYGGSIEKRSRFLFEIVEAVTAAVGADRTGLRLSPWGTDGGMEYGISPIPQWSHVVQELEGRPEHLSYIHLQEPGEVEGKVPRHRNDFVREIWSGVLVRGGSFGKDYGEIEEVLARDNKLIVAIGRFSVSNPDFVAKIKRGEPLAAFDGRTFYWDGESDLRVGYTSAV